MARPERQPLSKRLKNAAIFVGVVWALAGSFVAFELLSLSATDVALSNLSTFGNVVLSGATQNSTACEVQPGEAAGQAGAVTPAEARQAAWLFGVHHGRGAQTGQWGANGTNVTAQAAADAAQVAKTLGVPPPAAFTPAQIANANTEFVSFIENDAGGTAHRLALLYSPDACRIYKLGAFWGYAMLVRMALPGERSIYAQEINYYGGQVGLPVELVEAMIARTPAAATGQELVADTVALTERVTKQLGAAP